MRFYTGQCATPATLGKYWRDHDVNRLRFWGVQVLKVFIGIFSASAPLDGQED